MQAKAAAQAGADIVAVIRATAQSLLDYVPHGATTEGYGGTFATQENFKIIRRSLDEASEERGRYIQQTNYSSGLCMAEIAWMAAVERLDMLLNDAMYGILFRDINMCRTFVDQYVSRRFIARSGIVINTGEDNYLTTADAVEKAHTVLASQFINEAFALRAGLVEEQMGLGHAYEIDPWLEDSFLLEVAQAQLVRQIFDKHPIKWMPPTKHKTEDIFFAHVHDALFNLVGVTTHQSIELLGMFSEAIHNPLLMDRYLSLKATRYVYGAARHLGDEIEFKRDGIVAQARGPGPRRGPRAPRRGPPGDHLGGHCARRVRRRQADARGREGLRGRRRAPRRVPEPAARRARGAGLVTASPSNGTGSSGLWQLFKERRGRGALYGLPGYWDARTSQRRGMARSLWPSNVYNELWDERRQALLVRALGDVRGRRVADVGSGTGRVTRWLVEQRGASHVLGLDFSQVTVDAARGESGALLDAGAVAFARADILEGVDARFRGEFDDAVTLGCLAVACADRRALERALANMASLVRPGGRVLLLEPIHRARSSIASSGSASRSGSRARTRPGCRSRPPTAWASFRSARSSASATSRAPSRRRRSTAASGCSTGLRGSRRSATTSC